MSCPSAAVRLESEAGASSPQQAMRAELQPPKRPHMLGVQARAVPYGCCRVSWETSVPSAPHQGRDGTPVTGTAGVYYQVASARPFAHGRAKRLAEHGDSPREGERQRQRLGLCWLSVARVPDILQCLCK